MTYRAFLAFVLLLAVLTHPATRAADRPPSPEEVIRSLAPEVAEAIGRILALHAERSREHFDRGGDAYEFRFDWSTRTAPFVAWVDEARSPALRRALLMRYLQIATRYDTAFGSFPVDPGLAKRAVTEIGPTSALWSHDPEALHLAVVNSGERESLTPYLEQVLEKHPDRRVRSRLLFDLVRDRSRAGHRRIAGELHERLVAEAGEDSTIVVASRGQLLIGRPVPPFSLQELDGEALHTPSRFEGTAYLLDFWAAWCGPCVREMKYLHDAHERFGPSGFTILSVSFDRTRKAVRRFRTRRWPMPWDHAFVGGGALDRNHAAVRDFVLLGLPDSILVDGRGTVVARGDDLRGPRLAATLEAVLARAQPGQSPD